jgi:hypothetical protein
MGSGLLAVRSGLLAVHVDRSLWFYTFATVASDMGMSASAPRLSKRDATERERHAGDQLIESGDSDD